ncbi:MAG: preprotein translocase subunit SecG [Thermoguttaceae bacterium]|jgi:preprotein translocase subunit SecG
MVNAIFLIFLFASAIFLIVLVLIQRGKGGGLAGALGGMGGQSAFGTKAGDLFTRITMVAAALWILLCVVCVKWFNAESGRLNVRGGQNPAPASAPGPSDESGSSPAPADGAQPNPPSPPSK